MTSLLTKAMDDLVQLFCSERTIYVRHMLRAIDLAREPVWDFDERGSRTDGLRVIRHFEEVNNTTFNPQNEYHRYIIRGQTSHENFFRKLRLKRFLT